MNDMSSLLGKFLDFVLNLLPTSPFSDFIDSFSAMPFLGYLNWFVPVGAMLKIGTAWLAAIALFYLYSIIARWIKLIS